ncbi:hypothetical protein [Streptomyces sp. enrichment culture]|uniref:hypothetical protein n=1 Tax=Streptomyces sp. enrichment culture TaxID=1795815 RepID=UPI003F5617DB
MSTVLVVLGASFAVWMWLKAGDSDGGASRCQRVLSELGVESTGSVQECGDALETAMTGKPAGEKAPKAPAGRLPDAQSRNFEKVLTAFTKDVGPEVADIPVAIRGNMANAVTYYTDDVFQILGGHVNYSHEKYSTAPNDIDLDRSTVLTFLRPLAENEKAFDSIRASVFHRIDSDIATLNKADLTAVPKQAPGEAVSDKAKRVARESGRVTGALRKLSGEAITVKHGEVSGKREAALARDAERFGLPRLEQAFRSRAESLSSLSTPEGASRLRDTIEVAQESYWDRSGGY